MRATLLSPLLSACLLLVSALAPAHAQRAALAGLTEGVDYALIEGGKPYRAVPGKLEVAEVFAYWCSHCATFAPMLEAWKRTLPKHVQLVYVPSALDKTDAYARFHFAAEAAKAKGIKQVVFDRGGNPFHGKVKALADAAREAGLNF